MKNRIAQRMAEINPFHVMELLQRAKELEKQGRDIIHMEIGEPDFKTPDPVLRAGIACLAQGDVGYTEAQGLLELRIKIAQYYQECYQQSVAVEQIFITPGASGALLLALAATLNPQDHLLMADPGYPCNRNFVQLFDATPKLIPVDAETRYQLTAELVQQYWCEHTKGVLITTPSNPTGTVIPDAELGRIVVQVAKEDGILVVDETYQGLLYGHPPTTALRYSEDVFILNSFSKYFGMTGWRIGWLIVPKAFTSSVLKLSQNLFIATSTPAQYAALAAFEDDNMRILENRRLEFSKRQDYLIHELLRLGFKIPLKPEGAFYLYANCADFTDDSFKFAYELLESEGVAVTPGKDFGTFQAEQYLRFAYTTSIERIAEAIGRLEHFINQKKEGV